LISDAKELSREVVMVKKKANKQKSSKTVSVDSACRCWFPKCALVFFGFLLVFDLVLISVS
jgi:hypothetical protein